MKRVFLVLTTLFGCVGTDYVDDTAKPENERIIVSHQTIALMPNQQAQIEAEYFDQYGIMRDVQLVWISTYPAIAEVNDFGVVIAIADGQTIVQPSYGNFLGPQIQVTVVSDTNAVATVELINPGSTDLDVEDEVQLDAIVKNINGEELPDKIVEWFSENNSILTVSQLGLVKAVSAGIAGIHAKSEGVKSNSINFSVTGSGRSGTFVSAGGYHTSGSAQLELINGELLLKLSNDFNTDFALGTYIYLANSTNGPTVRSSGFQVAQIFSDGAKTFNISQLNPSVGLNDYKYVISLCYPASVTFGYAELK